MNEKTSTFRVECARDNIMSRPKNTLEICKEKGSKFIKFFTWIEDKKCQTSKKSQKSADIQL